MITIRQGEKTDSAAIANYLMLAMEEIVYLFIGQRDEQQANHFLKTLVEQEGNQYSYHHNWVIESDGEIVATALVYNGADLDRLRKPVKELVERQFNRPFQPEDETQPGEYYIDCIGVNPNQQGKGFGSKVLDFLIQEYVEKQNLTLGLLVDDDNPKAKKLYERLGFKVMGKKTLLGKSLDHMQLSKG